MRADLPVPRGKALTCLLLASSRFVCLDSDSTSNVQRPTFRSRQFMVIVHTQGKLYITTCREVLYDGFSLQHSTTRFTCTTMTGERTKRTRFGPGISSVLPNDLQQCSCGPGHGSTHLRCIKGFLWIYNEELCTILRIS